MAKTVLAADQNEEQLGTECADVLLGGQTLRCLETSYRVRVGKHQATMSTTTSETFPWSRPSWHAGDLRPVGAAVR